MDELYKTLLSSLYDENCLEKQYSKIYKIHKYWARKPWFIVEKYIKEHSKINDVVMDPFCGSGVTGAEAIVNGRNFIGQDLNPMSILVTQGTLLNNINFEDLKEDFKKIQDACQNKIQSLYYVDSFCPSCGAQMVWKHLRTGPKFKNSYTGVIYCPYCNSKATNYSATPKDIERIESNYKIDTPYWFPTTKFPKKFYKDRFSYKGISCVADMYTPRNLYALSLIYNEIQKIQNKDNRLLLLLAFTNTVLHVSKLKGENVRPLGVNNYWIPDDHIEENVWFRYVERVKLVCAAKEMQQQRYKKEKKSNKLFKCGSWQVEKKSALESMGKECVDYYFTDPPYGEAIQYSELSFIWNAWLKEEYDNKEEIIINPVQKKNENDFENLLKKSLQNIYIALKKEKYFTLCFQNKSFGVWKPIIEHCKSLGFSLVDVSIYNTYGNSFNKLWAHFSPKSDIYVTFQKKEACPEYFYDKKETIADIIKNIYIYTQKNHISTDNNKLYDFVVSYLIWSLYYNKADITLKSFTLEKFISMANEAINPTSPQLKLF